jgi:hypothetical protein
MVAIFERSTNSLVSFPQTSTSFEMGSGALASPWIDVYNLYLLLK